MQNKRIYMQNVHVFLSISHFLQKVIVRKTGINLASCCRYSIFRILLNSWSCRLKGTIILYFEQIKDKVSARLSPFFLYLSAN